MIVPTNGAFGGSGLQALYIFTPIVEWSEVEKMITQL
jgi:hypothetical protein